MTSPKTSNPAHLSPENALLKILRITVGVSLGVQAAIFFFLACFIGMMTVFLGSLAFLSGAGNASDQQIKETGLLLLLTVVYPFVWTMMLVAASINILSRRRTGLTIIFCVVSIISEIGIAIYMRSLEELQLWMTSNSDRGLKLMFLLSILVPLAGVMMGFAMRSHHQRIHHRSTSGNDRD